MSCVQAVVSYLTLVQDSNFGLLQRYDVVLATEAPL